MAKLATFVHMAEKVGDGGDNGSHNLHGDMPATAHNAEDHAIWKDEAKGQNHQQDMNPQARVEWVGRDGLAFRDCVRMSAMGPGRRGEEDEGEW